MTEEESRNYQEFRLDRELQKQREDAVKMAELQTRYRALVKKIKQLAEELK